MKVKVPCSTANFGSGIDCMGAALNRYLYVEAEISSRNAATFGDGFSSPIADGDNLFLSAAASVFRKAGQVCPGIRMHMTTEIPLSRGLGSSASAIVAGTLFANKCLGEPYTVGQLIDIATALEGHPDNIVPCMVGGFTIAAADAGKVSYARSPIGTELRFVTAIPAFTLSTREARAVLPRDIPLATAVRQIQRACLLTSSLQNGHWESLRFAMQDEIFTPARKHLIPGWDAVVSAAEANGALGVMISGAGPTVIALTTEHETEIEGAMQAAFEQHGIACETVVLEADQVGACVETE